MTPTPANVLNLYRATCADHLSLIKAGHPESELDETKQASREAEDLFELNEFLRPFDWIERLKMKLFGATVCYIYCFSIIPHHPERLINSIKAAALF